MRNLEQWFIERIGRIPTFVLLVGFQLLFWLSFTLLAYLTGRMLVPSIDYYSGAAATGYRLAVAQLGIGFFLCFIVFIGTILLSCLIRTRWDDFVERHPARKRK